MGPVWERTVLARGNVAVARCNLRPRVPAAPSSTSPSNTNTPAGFVPAGVSLSGARLLHDMGGGGLSGEPGRYRPGLRRDYGPRSRPRPPESWTISSGPASLKHPSA